MDLLDNDISDKYLLEPGKLKAEILALEPKPEWVVIDEIQKIPSLLDTVHQLIEKKSIQFALSGSSARKLKKGGANLLAGRAFVYHLHPFTHLELEQEFSLEHALSWGSLPGVRLKQSIEAKERFLETYCHTYLREEIVAEQIVRKLRPFRKFLELIAQNDGEIINFSKFSKIVGADSKTIKNYFEILEDTLTGIRLPAYEKSLRKQFIKSPKFYLFDCGISRALSNHLHLQLEPSTYEYGKKFEQFIILEFYRLNDYFRKKFSLSYFKSKDGVEIDLVLEKPGAKRVFIEIKSSKEIQKEKLDNLKNFKKEFPDTNCYCLADIKTASIEEGVLIMPWKEGIKEILGLK